MDIDVLSRRGRMHGRGCGSACASLSASQPADGLATSCCSAGEDITGRRGQLLGLNVAEPGPTSLAPVACAAGYKRRPRLGRYYPKPSSERMQIVQTNARPCETSRNGQDILTSRCTLSAGPDAREGMRVRLCLLIGVSTSRRLGDVLLLRRRENITVRHGQLRGSQYGQTRSCCASARRMRSRNANTQTNARPREIPRNILPIRQQTDTVHSSSYTVHWIGSLARPHQPRDRFGGWFPFQSFTNSAPCSSSSVNH
ncbi:hypothetical protein C8R44DRAFT_863187 [Mycena epipterygia]|nr:hypothetical protein C8R44DRAFT_863187 [Mycena epipterygia]